MAKMIKNRAPQNRTIILSDKEKDLIADKLLRLKEKVSVKEISGRTINSDFFNTQKFLPENFVDLLFLDPPYNLYKKFNNTTFKEIAESQYEEWFESVIENAKPLLKNTASVYVCCDWKTSPAIYNVLKKHFKIRNRITWERDKGRGAKSNWKNNTEDIWFCTVSEKYHFDLDAVKIKKQVIAPYTNDNGDPKDWIKTEDGNFRTTHPSNIWTDITVPFWSMIENTDHPTQKPEKLLAKIILASTRKNDFVFDPFLGSGTTSVAAKKLGRNYCGVEVDEFYCCLTEKRLEMAEQDKTIQGFESGIFTERNFELIKRKQKRIFDN